MPKYDLNAISNFTGRH